MAERRLGRIYRPAIAKAKGQERDGLHSEFMFELDILAEERAEIRLRTMRRLARKYPTVVIPRLSPSGADPIEDDNWDRDSAYSPWRLKPHVEAAAWLQIEDARKRRRDAWLAWLPIISAITGLVGAATGLAALLLKK